MKLWQIKKHSHLAALNRPLEGALLVGQLGLHDSIADIGRSERVAFRKVIWSVALVGRRNAATATIYGCLLFVEVCK